MPQMRKQDIIYLVIEHAHLGHKKITVEMIFPLYREYNTLYSFNS